jgi:hypothetical protein
MNSTQLSDFNNFDTQRIIFSKPEVGNIPNAISKLTFKRIRIAVRNKDGTIGDLIMATPPNLLCYGIQEQTDPSNGSINGYQFPMVLWNRNNPSPQEKAFTDTIHRISDMCKEHLLAHKDNIEKYDLEMNDLKKFNPLYYKMEKGKIVDGKGPMLYIKTLSSRKPEGIKIHTVFTDETTNEIIDPLDLMNKRCYGQGAIKFESIFVGNKISLQVKLFEARVKVVDTAFRSLLNPSVMISNTSTYENIPTDTIKGTVSDAPETEIQETGSIEDDEQIVISTPVPIPSSEKPKEEAPNKRGPASKKK